MEEPVLKKQQLTESHNPSTSSQDTYSLRAHVEDAVTNYFKHLDGQKTSNLYDIVISEVEEPLLKIVMIHTQNNQSKAAELLGLSRGTLRKKLELYGML